MHLTEGIPAHEIAIAAASPATWDDHTMALAQAADLPVHFIHGRPALSTREGQLAAALAEILLRGLSRSRMVRFIRLLSSLRKRFRPLEGEWWKHLPQEAPLLSADRWKKRHWRIEAGSVRRRRGPQPPAAGNYRGVRTRGWLRRQRQARISSVGKHLKTQKRRWKSGRTPWRRDRRPPWT